MLTLVGRSDQRRAAIEMVDDVENRLVPILGRVMRYEKTADPQMGRRTPPLGDIPE